MKELFAKLKNTETADFLVDTCFLYWVFAEQKEKEFVHFCTTNSVALSSFTIEEVLFHAHDVTHVFRERFRKVVKHKLPLQKIAVPVHPGNPEAELTYIADIDPELIQLVPDHSDAVLAALATQLGATLLTRDKHHLFTTQLENYFSKKNIQVLNNFP